jgi:hypothetical protein
VNELGTKWAEISRLIKGRSDNAIKNRWYSGLRKVCSVNSAGIWALKEEVTEKKHPKKSVQAVNVEESPKLEQEAAGERTTFSGWGISEIWTIRADESRNAYERYLEFWY